MKSHTLIGRDLELAAVGARLSALPDRGGAVMLRGAPGVGKSALLGEAAFMARAKGCIVLESAGVEAEASLPFGGLHQLLHPLSAKVDRLPRVEASALRAALGSESLAVPESRLVEQAVLDLVREVASEGPVVILVDDAHWVDEPTQEVLASVARSAETEPILLVAASVAGASGPLTGPDFPQTYVQALSDAEARDLLHSTAPGLSYRDETQILLIAEGNPLAIVELPRARDWNADGHDGEPRLTPRLKRAFACRVDGLPEATRAAVLVAAASSSRDVVEVLTAATVLCHRRVGSGDLRPAAAAGLLQISGPDLSFRHPLMRSAVLLVEPLGRRMAAHAALAAVPHTDQRGLVWHRAQSILGHDDDIADNLAEWAIGSAGQGSIATTVISLERSADLTSDPSRRAGRLLLAAQHAFALGRSREAERLLHAVEPLPLFPMDLARRELLREHLGTRMAWDSDRVDQLCALAEQTMAANNRGLAMDLMLAAALRAWCADPGATVRAQLAEAADRMAAETLDARHICVVALAEPVSRAIWIADRIRQLERRAQDAETVRLLGVAAYAVGDCARAARLLAQAASVLRKRGDFGHLPQVLTMQASALLSLGEWDLADGVVTEARQAADETDQPVWMARSLVIEATGAGLRGDVDRCFGLTVQPECEAERGRLTDLLAGVALARASAYAAAGRFEDTVEALIPLFDPLDVSHHERECFTGLPLLAEAAVRVGRRDEVRRILLDLEGASGPAPSPILRIHLLYAWAMVADDDAAEALFRAALEEELTDWPWVLGRLQLAFGAWLRRHRRVAESRQPLRTAAAMLDSVGAHPWAHQARAELRAAGDRVREHDEPANPGPLSPQELRISRLAATGLSNREIAQRLHLSPRTVASHLYRVFPKLSITSRAQLTGRFEFY